MLGVPLAFPATPVPSYDVLPSPGLGGRDVLLLALALAVLTEPSSVNVILDPSRYKFRAVLLECFDPVLARRL